MSDETRTCCNTYVTKAWHGDRPVLGSCPLPEGHKEECGGEDRAPEPDGTYLAAAKLVKELAAKDFAEHEIRVEGEGRYFCGKPGTSIMSFRVVFAPGHVFIFGDVGDAMLEGNDREMLPWIRGVAGRDTDYLLSKVVAAQRIKEFYPGDAINWLRERWADDDNGVDLDSQDGTMEAELLRNLCAGGDLALENQDGSEWARAVYEATGDSENCSVGVRWCTRLLWLAEALAVFVRLEKPLAEAKSLADEGQQLARDRADRLGLEKL